MHVEESYRDVHSLFCLFLFNDAATTEIYTLSLHAALPISTPFATTARASVPATAAAKTSSASVHRTTSSGSRSPPAWATADRKSTRLNSSHANISYAVFCLKKKN